MIDRYSLPGAASFFSAIIDALRDGTSMVVAAPSTSAESLTAALETRLSEDWRITGPLEPKGGAPIDEVWEALGIEISDEIRRSAAQMVASIDSKRLVIVSAIEVRHWPDWKQFICEYAEASRAVPELSRTQLIIITAGIPKSSLPSRTAALRQFLWDGVFGEADVVSYIMQSWPQGGRRIDAKAKLICQIITRLGLWDFDLVDWLLGMNPRDLFEPLGLLQRASEELPSCCPTASSWEMGGVAQVDGEDCVHSLWLLHIGDPNDELSMRLWAAQAAQLLPALELQRRCIARRMKHARLSLPMLVDGEKVYDPLHLEIGPLFHQARLNRLPRDIIQAAERCWDTRNKLAHLQTLSAAEALDYDYRSSGY